ncbi:hypothetical protein EWM64_g4088 [Hericium alpestre]|uniref:BTB domain-containing protein n=1 Tax=Hericium alpestre TaxID=135208 RepID=A0A4Z0A0Q9_9AGAM|nr:hypothetical protein EWM64_g4088 [Hericium alpestre]
MSEARPEKRSRLSDEVEQVESIENNSTVPLFTKSDPWFDDGNIILSCGNTGFRVHQGVLALHSPVFKDMLTVGNPGGVLFEGCGVVALTDDADDVRHLLNAMYLIEYGSGRERSLEMLSSMLRMSTKYVVDRFRKQVIQRLSSMFPSTLAKYTAAVRDRRILAKLDPIAAVQLSLDCDVPSILPTALYLCIIREEKTSAVLQELCQAVYRDNVMPQSQPAYHRILFEKRLRELLDGVFEAHDRDKIWAHPVGDSESPEPVGMNNSPSCKRLRVEDESQASIWQNAYPPFSRTSSQFWLADGSIVLVCGATGFRVHKSVLALRSAVFRDIFSIDEDHGINETFDGCVVVRLSDDATDMLRLLEALYTRKYSTFSGKSEITLAVMDSLLKLSTKYFFDDLRAEMVDFLRDMFPCDRSKYDFWDSRSNVRQFNWSSFVAVEFAMTYNIPAILPAACYEAMFVGISAVFNTELRCSPEEKSIQLSDITLSTCVLFAENWRDIVEDVLDIRTLKQYPGVDMPDNCGDCGGFLPEERQAVERQYRTVPIDVFRPYPALHLKLTGLRNNAGKGPACRNCYDELENFEEHIRDQLWNQMTKACGYDDWDAVLRAVPETDLDA